MTGQKIQAGKANENGDVEQQHYRLKRGKRPVITALNPYLN